MDNETKVQKVNHSLAEEHIPRELGLRLSSFFMYDRLVFVEGASDEAIVRELASTIGANLAQSNVGFVQMGGARNFAYYATEASLSFLTKRRVKMWFLLDRDERNDDDVAAFFERVGSHAAVHILARREIENYLIVPRAISKFIGLKRELGSTTHDQPSPSINQVESAIDQHVRELREIVLGKHLASIAGRPVYANLKGKLESLRDTDPLEVIDTELERMIEEVTKRRNLLESQRDEALRAIEQSWDQSSIDIVPGDLLIDRVCQDFGVRYVKETDASRLAGILTADEIHLELKSFLGSVI